MFFYRSAPFCRSPVPWGCPYTLSASCERIPRPPACPLSENIRFYKILKPVILRFVLHFSRQVTSGVTLVIVGTVPVTLPAICLAGFLDISAATIGQFLHSMVAAIRSMCPCCTRIVQWHQRFDFPILSANKIATPVCYTQTVQ